MDSKRLHFILWHKLCHTRLKTPISPWCGTQSRDETAPESRPAICEPQPSPRPCQNRAWHRAKSARRRNNNIYRRTSKTHTAHVLVIRPHEHTMFAQALAAGKASHESTNLTSPLPGPGLSRRAGRQRANHNDLPGIRLHGHIPAVADANPVQIRRQSPLIPPCVFSPQRVAQRNIPAPDAASTPSMRGLSETMTHCGARSRRRPSRYSRQAYRSLDHRCSARPRPSADNRSAGSTSLGTRNESNTPTTHCAPATASARSTARAHTTASTIALMMVTTSTA